MSIQKTYSMRGRAALRGVAWLAVALASPLPAHAAQTDPILAIRSVAEQSAPSGRLLHVEGSFPAADLVQLRYPLQILVRDLASGTGYVRFDLAGSVMEGSFGPLADGLSNAEIAPLLAVGTATADGRVLFLGPGRIDLLLPSSFVASTAEVQIFVIHQGNPILSNAVSLSLAGAKPLREESDFVASGWSSPWLWLSLRSHAFMARRTI